jgi:uncharacterized membrane protein
VNAAFRYLAAYFGAALALAGLDSVWLSFANDRVYRPTLHAILTTGFRPAPAIIFYVLYLAGLTIFATRPAVEARRWRLAPVMGGLFGFFAYATYDLTNQATLAIWATKITLIDLAWGTFLSATGATAGYFASKLIRRV